MRKTLLVATAAVVMTIGLASVGFAQSSPPPDIQYIQTDFYARPPSSYPPGVSVGEVTSINQGFCGGKTGILHTVRLGDRVTQMMVTDQGNDCSRAGSVSQGAWANLDMDRT